MVRPVIDLEPSNPSSGCIEDINVTKAIEYLKEVNAQQDQVKVTMTHLIGHSMAWGLYKMRRDIGRFTFGYFTHSKKIGITCLVDVEGSDLVPVTLWDAHNMTLIEFAQKCSERVLKAKDK